MIKRLEVELTEEDVELAIKQFVLKYQNLEVKKINMRTAVRGDYDKGDAEEYVERVVCECDFITEK